MIWRANRCGAGSLAALLCLAAATACTSGPPPATAPTAPTASSVRVPDWLEIPVAPLGSALAALYPELHEVLYFQGPRSAAEQPGSVEPQPAADCYRANGSSPRVLSHLTDDYVLCFVHDRLTRVEAVLELPVDAARSLAQQLCDAWLPGSLDATRSEYDCGGRRGDAAFRVLRGNRTSESGVSLSIVVSTPPIPVAKAEGTP
jgi:hypothetical protein